MRGLGRRRVQRGKTLNCRGRVPDVSATHETRSVSCVDKAKHSQNDRAHVNPAHARCGILRNARNNLSRRERPVEISLRHAL